MKTLIFASLILLLFPTGAQNLITNSTFDSDVSDWSGIPTQYFWSDTHGGPISGPGSMYLEKEIINNNRIFGVSATRVAVQEGYTYWFTGMGRIPASSSAFRVWARITWFDVLGDNLAQSPSILTIGSFPTDTWVPVEGAVMAPENAVEARITANIESVVPDKGQTVLSFGYWDDVYFLEDTIFFSTFD